MRHPVKKLGDFCRTGSGSTPSRSEIARYYEGGVIPWVKSGELREGLITSTEERVTEAALAETSIKLVPAGAILLAMYGATVGRLAILGVEATTNQAVCHIAPDPNEADTRYLYHAIAAQVPAIIAMGVGGAQPNISQGLIKDLKVQLPLLAEQRRIAAILDQADALRAKRREALALLDELQRGIFNEMFGDPASNPKRWTLQPLGGIASKFSDGPFGSNLKSEHYVEHGVRVVRLQNIGVGKFNDADKAFVSKEHYATIRKHECRPGDVLVGTLGDPNLRACLLPEEIPLAINKADCVQIRVNPAFANSYFVSSLINHPSTEQLAQELKRGQTRVRISMGSLRGLKVPMPPLALQDSFARRVTQLEQLRVSHLTALKETSRLFQSLQSRAFGGEL